MNECNCGLKRIGFRYQSNSLYREEKESSLDAAGLNKQLKTKNSWMNVMNETGRCVNFINQINLINSFTCLGLVFSIQSSFFWDWFRSTIRESIRKKNWMKNQCRPLILTMNIKSLMLSLEIEFTAVSFTWRSNLHINQQHKSNSYRYH